MFFYSMVAIDMHEPVKELKWWAVIFISLTPLNNGDTIVRGIGDSEGVQNTDWTDFSDSFAVFFPADLLRCFWLSFILDDFAKHPF